MTAKTLFEKIWDAHVVAEAGGWTVLYIDRHLGHDGAARAFTLLRERGARLRRPDKTLLVLDHMIPTRNQAAAASDPQVAEVFGIVRAEAARFGIEQFYDVGDERNGIAHVVGPEQGYSLPGITLVCGDSHTSTHGAFGALAFGIGASEVTHVFVTQCLLQLEPRSMLVRMEGTRPPGVYAKDVILALIGRIGTGGGTGCVIEYAGQAVTAMSMEERMTVCNMTIEAGARAGLVAPDETTYAYLEGRPLAPRGDAWERAVAHWRGLPSDPGASYDRTVALDVSTLAPQVTWGTSPGMVTSIDGTVPDPGDAANADEAAAWEAALSYMDLRPGTPLEGLPVDRVFLGSCTNSRIEDLREAARYARGGRVAPGVRAMVVPGSGLVKKQAEAEGLDTVFEAAGFDWREPGCSMCVGMNGDLLAPGERCASTTNRNFEGRQGRGGRTHLVSPVMAVGAALHGHLVDARALAPAD